MPYVKAKSQKIEAFPYSIGRMRRDNRNTSFPASMPDEMLAEFEVYPVAVDPKPVAPKGKIAERNDAPELRGGSWYLGWIVRDMTQEEVDLWRARATRKRAPFCIAAKRLGMLTPEEAILASGGGWPQSFTDALAKLPAEIDSDDAKIIWAGIGEVHRNDPVLNAVATAKGFTPKQVDKLFQ